MDLKHKTWSVEGTQSFVLIREIELYAHFSHKTFEVTATRITLRANNYNKLEPPSSIITKFNDYRWILFVKTL